MKVYLLVGLPGSGKSTWAKKKAKDPNTVIVNRDAIRTMLKGEYVYDKELEGLVEATAVNILGGCIEDDYDVVIDETNLTFHKRAQWVSQLKMYPIFNDGDMEFEVVYFTESENNLAYRMCEPRGYTAEKWETVLDAMKQVFNPPRPGEFPAGTRITEMAITDDPAQVGSGEFCTRLDKILEETEELVKEYSNGPTCRSFGVID